MFTQCIKSLFIGLFIIDYFCMKNKCNLWLIGWVINRTALQQVLLKWVQWCTVIMDVLQSLLFCMNHFLHVQWNSQDSIPPKTNNYDSHCIKKTDHNHFQDGHHIIFQQPFPFNEYHTALLQQNMSNDPCTHRWLSARKTTPLLAHWGYVFLALNHWNEKNLMMSRKKRIKNKV